MEEPSTLKKAIDQVPGKASGAAKACGVSVRAVYKWLQSGRLPRTDYTGETEYAKKLADASGGLFSAEWLLNQSVKTGSRATDSP